MARTTIDIDPSVLAEAKELARKRGTTLGETLSVLVAEALAVTEKGSTRPYFTWTSRPMGIRIDLEDKDAVEVALAAEE